MSTKKLNQSSTLTSAALLDAYTDFILSRQMSETSVERTLTKRVELLGRHAGIEGLSTYDCRHFWTTYEARNRTPIDRLKDAGGWNSVAMPLQ